MWLAAVILVILGFVILLLFIYNLGIGKYAEDRACEASVLARATSPDAAQRAIPLKCTTKKICLSQEGKDCPAFIGEDAENVKLSGDILLAKDKIEKETADAIYYCWKNMKEGKLDISGGGKNLKEIASNSLGLQYETSTCVVCDRIALAPDVMQNKALLNEIDVNGYMENHFAPGSEELSYIEALTDSQMSSYTAEFEKGLTQSENPTDEIAIIFMQIFTKEGAVDAGLDAAKKTGTFIVGGSLGLGSLGILTLPGAILSIATVAGTGSIAAFQTWRSKQVSLARCEEFTTEEKAQNGCSVVTAFDYHDIENLNNYCGRVEGLA